MGDATRGTLAHSNVRPLDARTVGSWALSNTFAGLVIGLAIRWIAGSALSAGALVPVSIVFANVVGFAAMLAVRFVLPRYSGFPAYVRIPMAVVTLIAGGVFGSALAILFYPLAVYYQMRYALMVVCINGALALIVGLITYTYEQMRAQIEREASARGRLEHEMSVARDIQTELLPKTFPRIEGLDIFAFSVPARHVGGDCYDVIEIGDGKLAITIGDVAGKGTPAAILMANVQAAVRALSESGIPAGPLIERVNKLVHGYTEASVFITFCYCILNTRTGQLTYVNAGHNPPYVLRRDGGKDFLDRGGLIIGAVAGSTYEEGRLTMAPGDDLVLYTDGITEARNPSEEMFGEERLEALLHECRHMTAREIEERVYTSVKDFTAGASQSDDLTMVVVKMTAAGADADEQREESDIPKQASGGPSAARGAPVIGDLRGPAAADEDGADRVM